MAIAKWENVRLGDVVNINPQRRLSKGQESPYVAMHDLVPLSRSISSYDYREFRGSGSRFENSDTLLARITPCLENGKTSFVNCLQENEVGHGSTEFIVLAGMPNVTDNLFVYYLAREPEFRSFAIQLMEGTSGRQRVPAKALGNYQFNLPSLEEQRAIAHILGTLDDKIELNRRMNETLEEMARAIFKSWFIDFDPVKRNIARKSGQNQPSPRPSPNGRGRKGKGAAGLHYRGGYQFSGLLKTARELRGKQTPAEEILWQLLRDRQFMGLKFRRQHQIGDYIVDFYCHEERIIIELDGPVHSDAAHQKKDAKRDAYLQSLGLVVLRFPNKQVLEDPQSVLEQIAAHCVESGPESSSPFGRGEGQGSVEELDRLFPDSFEDSELGRIPKGWKVAHFGKEFKITMGQSPPGSTYNEDGEGPPFFQGRRDFGFRYPGFRIYCSAPQRMAYAGDTLVSVRAPVGEINMAPEECCIGRGIAALRHKSKSRSYTYHAAKSLRIRVEEFEAEGTVFGSISKGDFHNLLITAPPDELIAYFEEIAHPFDQEVEENEKESISLAAIRDALLPKLLSGEIRVKDAEKFVEEAFSCRK